MEEQKTDIIVIAPKGTQALLTITNRKFLINCYEPINLSNMFTIDQLEDASEFQAHLQDGNLIYYKGENLPEPPSLVSITPLKRVENVKLVASYTQKEETNTPKVRLHTTVDISPEMKDSIQVKVAENRQKILDADKKLLDSRQEKQSEIVTASSRPKERSAMSTDELKMSVHMDVDPKTFLAKQEASKRRLSNKNNPSKTTSDQVSKDATIETKPQ